MHTTFFDKLKKRLLPVTVDFIRGEGLIPSARFRVRASGRFYPVLNPRPIP